MPTVSYRDFTLTASAFLFMKVLAALGLVVGVIAFLGSIFGLPTETVLPFVKFEGVMAGVVSLVVGPVVFGMVGLLLGVIGYVPLKLVLKLTGGLRF